MKITITNNTDTTLDFAVHPLSVKDGVVVTNHVAPGETKDISIDPDDAMFKGRVIAGAITVAPKAAEKAIAADAAKT